MESLVALRITTREEVARLIQAILAGPAGADGPLPLVVLDARTII
jgi:hypothetical protein